MENTVLENVLIEKDRQLKIWGEQNHPCIDQTLLNREGSCTPKRMAEHYELPTEDRAKQLLENALAINQLTYAHIALEELCEVVGEFDPVKRKLELEQLAAVCINWAEKIERDLKQ